MNVYQASIVYNPFTLRRLNSVVSATFRYGLKLIYLGICVGLLVLGARLGLQTPRGVALVCIACFMLPSIRALDKSRAEQTIRRMNGKTLTVQYTFTDDHFRCVTADEKADYTYDTIARMVEQSDFLYLFPNANQAYMIDVSTLTGGDVDAFKAFLAEKVGLAWTKPMNLLSINLKQMRFNKQNTRL